MQLLQIWSNNQYIHNNCMNDQIWNGREDLTNQKILELFPKNESYFIRLF